MEYNKKVGFGTDVALSIGGLISSISQSEALRLQGQYAEKIGEMNARFAEMEAKETIEAGEREAGEHGKKISQMIGKQRAGFAAGNIKVDSGTAKQIQQQTRQIGFEEQRAIRNNAWRQAFGLKTQAFNARAGGSAQKAKYSAEADTTLITGGLKFASNVTKSMYNYYGDNTIDSKGVPDTVKKALKEEKADSAMLFDPAKYGRLA